MEDIEDDDFVASEHDRLIRAISKFDKTQHITKLNRNDPTISKTEFKELKINDDLNTNQTTKSLGETAHRVKIVKEVKKTQESSKVLPKPLEKPQAQRIKRATGYEETKKRVGRWDPVVARSRTLDYVTFPLKQAVNKLEPTKEFATKFTLKSPLEKQLEEVDPPPVMEQEEEEEPMYPMSYEDMVEHRQNLAKIRAKESYNAAKAKRQSKIKSKKYHRILKKEKLKQQLKEFEQLQKTDPEEALKKLEALEKSRALERHTLRHKNTGKWAKNKLVRAKYDKEVREQLAEQLSVSRQLTKKIQDQESSDDEADTGNTIVNMTLAQDPMNVWMSKKPGKSNIDAEFDFGYKKYLQGKINKKNTESDEESDKDSEKMATDNDKESTEINLDIIKEGIKKICEENTDDNNTEVDNEPPVKKQKVLSKKVDKKSKTKVIATSNWIVETNNGNNSEMKPTEEIMTAFDSLENTIASKVEKKLKNIRKNIENLEKRSKSVKKKKTDEEVEEETDNLEYLKFKNQKVKAIIDEELIETTTRSVEEVKDKNKLKSDAMLPVTNVQENINNANINPNRFNEVKPKYLDSVVPEGDNGYDQLDDDEQVVPKVAIEDVFEEDDAVTSFRKEKEDEANKDKPKDIDLTMPGWGSWVGKGVKAPKRRKNRFILKAPPNVPRRDENKGDIIIKEYKDPKLAAHKVSELPFPFTRVKDYEASIRAPIGNTFIPETAHKKLIKPSVITKAGTIIEPMDEEELLVPKNRKFRNEAVIKLLGQR